MEFFKSSGGLRGHKNQLFEGGIKVPTIVWWQNHIQPNTESKTPTAFWDWFPTLAAIAGAECEETNGVSLLPLFDGSSLPERGLYWEHGNTQAFRNGDWKLMRSNTKEGIDVKLFHLKDDPSETTNLATVNPAIVARLTAEAMESRTVSDDFPSFLDSEQQ